ncbi:AAA family ATPase [Paractinoplanes brasiliensis]|uniref:Nuclease SbcCD subunit C n=1 Tax=Paractinoplanes brasiliensis TaxID=52695 RepID=A0A4R6JS87_9ACTN|nr:AAA family ATPase [Actinoplanes brasiliensis]TDO38592.1 RecF/RecN/SMC family protein [Actinoplanes brasiliensis]GID26634.1 hypothetical protein Abr02nite_16170 [Actinoplanes brasiliensis]
MDDALTLYHELTDQLRAHGTTGPATDLILAAFRGEDALAAVMRGEPLPEAPADAAEADEAPEVYLESVEVTGFRGIGTPAAALRLKPQPGLTVIAGRNGSAKSSLAESIEYGLTEDSPRWSQRPPVFREGWRNMHYNGERAIAVKLRSASSGQPVVIRRTWAAGETDVAAATVHVTRNGVTLPSDALPEWLRPSERFRPFLSARDLERVIGSKPTELYDSIAPILGLTPLSEAGARLQVLRKERDDRAAALRGSFGDLRTRLVGLDDPRAGEAVHLLGKQAGKANLAALTELAAGETGDGDARAASAARRLAELGLPDIGNTLRELTQAEESVQQLARTEVAVRHRVADLLSGALEMHRDLGDQSCPVCQVGVLDGTWREQAEREVGQLRSATETMRAAARRREALLRQAQSEMGTVRGLLDPVVTALAPSLPEQAAELDRALDSPALDRPSWDEISAAHHKLGVAAAEWLANRHDSWREPGAAIRRWVEDAKVVRAEADELALLTKARNDLIAVTDRIRADRFQAAAQHSQHIWNLLRQESNVAIGEIRLGGTSTRRRVDISVAVDGTDTPALAVMSQGELHAFGLALFLPRACADASPYRFVVIDDPVQSMDPSKVDGFAEVLREVARTRQVVVFTHDDRLPEAIRRLGVEADVREVTRREGSIVEVRKNLWPAKRYLEDARAVALAEDIPEQAKRLMVAGFCRSALEATAMDRYRAEQYAAGTPLREIDAALDAAHSVQAKLTLGLFGDPGRRGDLYAQLNRSRVPRAVDTVKAVAKAVHGQCDMASLDMVVASEALVARLS